MNSTRYLVLLFCVVIFTAYASSKPVDKEAVIITQEIGIPGQLVEELNDPSVPKSRTKRAFLVTDRCPLHKKRLLNDCIDENSTEDDREDGLDDEREESNW